MHCMVHVLGIRWNETYHGYCLYRLAALLADKQGLPYSQVICWLRCQLSFSLLRSAIAAIRGTLLTKYQDNNFAHIDLAVAEGHVPSA